MLIFFGWTLKEVFDLWHSLIEPIWVTEQRAITISPSYSNFSKAPRIVDTEESVPFISNIYAGLPVP